MIEGKSMATVPSNRPGTRIIDSKLRDFQMCRLAEKEPCCHDSRMHAFVKRPLITTAPEKEHCGYFVSPLVGQEKHSADAM
jgi:hypothetical protein